MKPTEKGMRPEKIAEASELDQRVSGALYMILADYNGMDMPTTIALKESLRANGATYNVVKNRMLNRAVEDDMSALLKGQTAIIYGAGDVVEIAKVIKKFTAENKKPAIKARASPTSWRQPATAPWYQTFTVARWRSRRTRPST